jgi:hypothetical protein
MVQALVSNHLIYPQTNPEGVVMIAERLLKLVDERTRKEQDDARD